VCFFTFNDLKQLEQRLLTIQEYSLLSEVGTELKSQCPHASSWRSYGLSLSEPVIRYWTAHKQSRLAKLPWFDAARLFNPAAIGLLVSASTIKPYDLMSHAKTVIYKLKALHICQVYKVCVHWSSVRSLN
jgi:hypothetical protein